jgi:hypothetical protein
MFAKIIGAGVFKYLILYFFNVTPVGGISSTSVFFLFNLNTLLALLKGLSII